MVLGQLQSHESMTLRDLAEQIAVTDQQTELTSISEEALTEIEVALHHLHAPKLAEAGYVEYDSRRRLVAPTDRGRRLCIDDDCRDGRIEPSECVTVDLSIGTIDALHEAIHRDERLDERMSYDEIVGTLLSDHARSNVDGQRIEDEEQAR